MEEERLLLLKEH